AQNPHCGQWQAAAYLLAVGNTVRDVSGIASVCEIPSARDHAGGTGSLRPEPIRYRSRSDDAACQTQTLSKPAEEHRIIRCRPRLPLVGDQVHTLMERGKAKTKTFLRREKQDPAEAQHASRWSAPNDPKITRKESPLPPTSLPDFQAHPS